MVRGQAMLQTLPDGTGRREQKRRHKRAGPKARLHRLRHVDRRAPVHLLHIGFIQGIEQERFFGIERALRFVLRQPADLGQPERRHRRLLHPVFRKKPKMILHDQGATVLDIPSQIRRHTLRHDLTRGHDQHLLRHVGQIGKADVSGVEVRIPDRPVPSDMDLRSEQILPLLREHQIGVVRIKENGDLRLGPMILEDRSVGMEQLSDRSRLPRPGRQRAVQLHQPEPRRFARRDLRKIAPV